MEIKSYEEIMEQLQKESLVFVLYYNEENKLLISKGPAFDRYSIPYTRVIDKDSAYAYLNPILQKEFAINVCIKDYVELVRGFYKTEEGYKLGNLICYLSEEYKDYPGKPELEAKPEIFSEAKYVTYEELVNMYEQGEVTEYTMYFASRVQEQKPEPIK